MSNRPAWKLQMPRVTCPVCGTTLRCYFTGRFRVHGPRKDRRGEETKEEGRVLPCDATASAEGHEVQNL
jgi:hypothetical protein